MSVGLSCSKSSSSQLCFFLAAHQISRPATDETSGRFYVMSVILSLRDDLVFLRSYPGFRCAPPRAIFVPSLREEYRLGDPVPQDNGYWLKAYGSSFFLAAHRGLRPAMDETSGLCYVMSVILSLRDDHILCSATRGSAALHHRASVTSSLREEYLPGQSSSEG